MQSDFGDFTSNIGYEKWRRKAELIAHPLFEQLFSTHISCLQAGIPIRDQSRRIHAYLEHSRRVFAKYSTTTPLSNDHYYKNNQGGLGGESTAVTILASFTSSWSSHFVPLFSSYKDRLQQYVRPHTNACWELEQRIRCLTDVPLDKLDTGATVSDDDDEDIDELIKDIEARLNDESLDGSKVMGIGPLFPTEMERSMVDRVSQELKSELKEGYMEKIVDIREEILRKRKSGKLPGNTSSVLKSWWMSHSKWPYPTEEDKARLVEETGLQLKQINNWFINQRKRNWLNNSTSSSSTSKSKRKRYK
ncbi:hypothetical protein Syun_011200 [Stephania yunnanensis]|uniref:Uncharacterized protein n=1 Tax=Stephania yunnanensis TaxID=152371 RepID=A0AAP0JY46_9MAGN